LTSKTNRVVSSHTLHYIYPHSRNLNILLQLLFRKGTKITLKGIVMKPRVQAFVILQTYLLSAVKEISITLTFKILHLLLYAGPLEALLLLNLHKYLPNTSIPTYLPTN